MEEMVARLVQTEERAKSNSHRLDKLEDLIDAIHKQSEAIVTLGVELKHNTDSTENLATRVGNLEKRPGTLWDKLVFGLIGAVGGSMVSILGTVLLRIL